MAKLNCWEVKKCGLGPGGEKTAEKGVCPVAQANLKADGLNNGKNAGRICWAVAGTLCGGKVQGDFASKQATCMWCDFYKLVYKEEGEAFCLLIPREKRKA
jgi:hypothetical protein